MNSFDYPTFPTANGYMTEKIRTKYIQRAIAEKNLPENAHRMPQILTLDAPNEASKPIQFWQLYSVLGQDRIVDIVYRFYKRVFADEPWFTSVFANVGSIEHHVNTQASMWTDVMGGGLAYHGGEFRLSFHHTHNAMALMNQKGAERWVQLMVQTLDDTSTDLTDDPRVRRSLNTFLDHFLGKYATEFRFEKNANFGELNIALIKRYNFLNMSSDAIEALDENALREELIARGIDTTGLRDKQQLVNKALSL